MIDFGLSRQTEKGAKKMTRTLGTASQSQIIQIKIAQHLDAEMCFGPGTLGPSTLAPWHLGTLDAEGKTRLESRFCSKKV
jgi:hypothetical protein